MDTVFGMACDIGGGVYMQEMMALGFKALLVFMFLCDLALR